MSRSVHAQLRIVGWLLTVATLSACTQDPLSLGDARDEGEESGVADGDAGGLGDLDGLGDPLTAGAEGAETDSGGSSNLDSAELDSWGDSDDWADEGPGTGGETSTSTSTDSGSGGEAEEGPADADAGDDQGDDGDIDPVHPQRVRELAAGYDHACHLTDDGYIYCWGFGPGKRVPHRDGFPGKVVEIAAGFDWTCVLMELPSSHGHGASPRQALGCWGAEERLHDLDGSREDPYVEMDGAHGHLCLRRESGDINCTPIGPRGNNDWFDFDPPYDGNYTRVSVGRDHACALTDAGKIYCWGSRNWEQLYSSPPPSGRFTALASGSDYDCAVDDSATLKCWTRFTDRHRVLSELPKTMPQLRVVDASPDQLCVVSLEGDALCWPGDFLDDDPPEGPFEDVVVGRDYACAKHLDWMPDTPTTETECWGVGFGGDYD